MYIFTLLIKKYFAEGYCHLSTRDQDLRNRMTDLLECYKASRPLKSSGEVYLCSVQSLPAGIEASRRPEVCHNCHVLKCYCYSFSIN